MTGFVVEAARLAIDGFPAGSCYSFVGLDDCKDDLRKRASACCGIHADVVLSRVWVVGIYNIRTGIQACTFLCHAHWKNDEFTKENPCRQTYALAIRTTVKHE